MTTGEVLSGARVMVVEDDYYLATDLQHLLMKAGALVVGPFSDEKDALAAVATAVPDCALVDVNTGRGPSFKTARALNERSAPFVFVTGYDPDVIPEEFAGVPRLEKPIQPRKVIDAVAQMLKLS